jgi:hypothetical protein
MSVNAIIIESIIETSYMVTNETSSKEKICGSIIIAANTTLCVSNFPRKLSLFAAFTLL